MEHYILGNSDRPINKYSDDEFQIRPYVEGLAEFILDCETPMTVAVQGDWGCGKTSMMNMVRDYINPDGKSDDVVDVWFNTWQFSQFNMDQTLSVTFLQHLVNELSRSLNRLGEIKDTIIDKSKNILKTLAHGILNTTVGSVAGDVFTAITGDEKKDSDAASKIVELKQLFHDIINKVGKRVIVYIDDLDRLQPVRAIELLEILKLFVDCENCVFVMAIDTSVVFQGIREKYGQDMSESKAQSFFDKMIQLPFRMPVAYYKLDSMIERLLAFLNSKEIISDKREQQELIDVLKCTADGNPRSLKRLVNSIMLLDKVAVKKGLYGQQADDNKKYKMLILVCLSCLQHRFNYYYDAIVENINPMTISGLCNVSIPQNQEYNKLIENLCRIGMPELDENDDEKDFYKVMSYFLRRIKSFIEHKREIQAKDKDINSELVQIISLNNITKTVVSNGAEENDAEKPNMQSEETPNINDSEIIEKINADGVRKDVNEIYRIFESYGIYPLECYPTFEEKEYKTKLFRYLDTELGKYFKVDSSDSAGGNYDRTYRITQMEVPFKISLFQMSAVRTPIAYIEIGKTSVPFYTMKIAESVLEFIDTIKEEHKSLQNRFGKRFFSDRFVDELTVIFDENGKAGFKNNKFNFYVLDYKMADELINLAFKIAADPTLVQGEEQFDPNSVKLS